MITLATIVKCIYLINISQFVQFYSQQFFRLAKVYIISSYGDFLQDYKTDLDNLETLENPETTNNLKIKEKGTSPFFFITANTR